MTYDKQAKAYQITINNPSPQYSHETIKEILTLKFKTFKYAAMCDEIGKEGTPHTHCFVYFTSAVRFSTIKRHFPTAHIERVNGSVKENIDYIKKAGRWAGTDKSETNIPESFEEIGVRPAESKGKRSDMTELYQMVCDNLTNAEIIKINQDFILQIDKIDKVRTTVLTERFKETVRLDLEVIYISGATGTGKTKRVLEDNGFPNVYRVTDYMHPFDGYACQPVICFDEFRSSLKLKEMLLYCDIYPIELPARYSNKFACYNKVYIVSNWDLEKQYSEMQISDKESWDAFLRRIHKVIVFNNDGTRTEYDSVESYINRTDCFLAYTDDEYNPFI